MIVESLSIQKIQICQGEVDHYVCLQREIAEDDESQQQDLDDIADNIAEDNAEEIEPIRNEAKEVAAWRHYLQK